LMLFIAISVIVFFVMFNNIKFTIYSLILLVYFLDWFSSYLALLPRQITWLPEMLSFVLLVRIMFDLANKEIKIKNNFITYFVYFWLFLSIVGIAVNFVNPFVFIAGFRNYFKFIPVLLVFSWYPFPAEFVKRIIGFIIFIGLIQIFFIIPERIIFWADEGDLMVGSLGAHASGTLAIFQLLIFSILVALYKSNYYSLKKFMTYGGLVLLPTFITEAKVVFFLLPIVFAIYFLDFKGRMFARSAFLVILGSVVLVAGIYIYNSIYAEWRGRDIRTMIFSPEKALDDVGLGKSPYYADGTLRRATSVKFMLESINKDIYAKILGVGIGNASDSLFPLSRGHYHKKHSELYIDRAFWARFGWEFGYVGLIFLIVFFVRLYLIKRHKEYDAFYNGIFNGVKGMVVITVLSFVYSSFLTLNPLSLVFWLYLGILNNKLLSEKA